MIWTRGSKRSLSCIIWYFNEVISKIWNSCRYINKIPKVWIVDTIFFTLSNINIGKMQNVKVEMTVNSYLSMTRTLFEPFCQVEIKTSVQMSEECMIRAVQPAVCSVYRPYLCIKSVRRQGETRTISPSAWSTL